MPKAKLRGKPIQRERMARRGNAKRKNDKINGRKY